MNNCAFYIALSCVLLMPFADGQFQKMFGQQTVLDGKTGASDGKILIKSELDIKTTFMPEECEKVVKKGETISIEYDVCAFLFSITVNPGITSAYDVYVNEELVESSKGDEKFPPSLMEFTVGKGMVIQGLDLGIIGMCVGEKRTLKIPPQLAWGEKGIPGLIPANAEARFDVELMKIEDQSWTDWYVEIIQVTCVICFLAGAIALIWEKVRDRKAKGKKTKKSS